MDGNLFVGESTIAGAGKGLFTRRKISDGVVVAEYKGRIMLAKSHKDHTYCCELKPDVHLNASDEKYASLARFINDPRAIHRGPINNKKGEKSRARKANLRFARDRGRVVLISTQKIPAKSELFVDYGPAYKFLNS